MPFDVVFYMGKPMPPFPLFNLPFPSQLFARFRRVASFERSFSHEAHNLPINCWNRQVQVLLCVSVLTPNSRVISFRADVLAIRDYRSFKNLPPGTALTQAAARLLAQDDMSILSYGTASRASRNHPAKNAFDSVLLYSFSVPAPT